MKSTTLCQIVASFGILAFSQLSWAGAEYPKEVQVQISELVQKEMTETLRKAHERYNKSLSDPRALIDAVKKSGLHGKEVTEVESYSRNLSREFPKAEISDRLITIQDSGLKIDLGPKELQDEAIRVNGKMFRWNWGESASANLRRYDNLFARESKSSEWKLPAVLRDAWADPVTHQRLKIAGLTLYFITRDTEKKNTEGQFKKFTKEIRKLAMSCENADSLAQFSQESSRLLRPVAGDSLDFKSCKDVERYWGTTGKNLEKDKIDMLCKTIDRLSKCYRSLKARDPKSVSNSKLKNLPAPASDEWHESTSGNPSSGKTSTGSK